MQPQGQMGRSKMVEPSIETYIIAGVFGFVGIVFIWAVYQYRELPPEQRPELGTPGLGIGGSGGGARRWGIKAIPKK
jgi:hypothetical protein